MAARAIVRLCGVQMVTFCGYWVGIPIDQEIDLAPTRTGFFTGLIPFEPYVPLPSLATLPTRHLTSFHVQKPSIEVDVRPGVEALRLTLMLQIFHCYSSLPT